MARIKKASPVPSGEGKKLQTSARVGVFANSAVASAGAGFAAMAATGTVWPALALAVVGAVVGYTATNQIPKDRK